MQSSRLIPGAQPLIFGEVLFDVFPNGHGVLGGAPFNVAWHLQGLGLAPLFVSAVGRDAGGQQVLSAMRSWSMTTEAVSVDGARPTGQVTITLDGKDARYDIRPEQAYDHIDLTPVERLRGEQPISLVYHGSLIARGAHNRDALTRLVENEGLPAFVDVNLRDPWWDRDTVLGMLARARWVKLNADELATFVPGTGKDRAGTTVAAEVLRRRLDLELLVVTLGAEGAFICGPDGSVDAAAPRPEAVVDTVGAGDSFSAVTIYGLHRGWSPATMLERALAFASAVVAQRGATSMDRTLYQTCLEAWAG
jgi:fructokinase